MTHRGVTRLACGVRGLRAHEEAMPHFRTQTDTDAELFDNLEAMCDECPPLPGIHGESADDSATYESHEGYDRLMTQGLPMEVEWGTERLA